MHAQTLHNGCYKFWKLNGQKSTGGKLPQIAIIKVVLEITQFIYFIDWIYIPSLSNLGREATAHYKINNSVLQNHVMEVYC